MKQSLATAAVAGTAGWVSANATPRADKAFDISLAAWSVHRAFYAGELKQIDMPELCRKKFDISGLELVNSFFPSPQYNYLRNLSKRADDNGVKILLIMCDGEGNLAASDKKERLLAMRNHRKWVDIAAVLGCHSIRVNSGGKAGDADSVKWFAESGKALVDYAEPDDLNIIVENHGGISADPDAIIEAIKQVGSPRFGTLPDFGNFPSSVDRYEAVRKWMPYAKAVSAKCYDFDANGNETHTDYDRMMKIVAAGGYHGFVGIEYEGNSLSEEKGVMACKKLLLRCREALG
jgi:sugar phosphate isomerase/epimerase